MEADTVNPPHLPAPRGPYSLAVRAGGFVFTSGLLPILPGEEKRVSDDIREQALVVRKNLRSLLEEAGSSLDRVVKVTVYLSYLGDLPAFNEVYEEFFRPPQPARSAVQAVIPAGYLVELDAVAALKV
jgi:2-iminobutanoate/2-iminopropanoate deaminase